MNTSLTLSQVKDIPAVRQAGLLLALAAAVALGIALFFWSLSPNFSTLYSNLPDRDAAEVVEALRAAQIPYEMDQVSGAILVPEAQLREARMKLAAQGLPQSARPGIESINENPGFGTSQFVEGARYQHALEMEIARTISELRPVREARVHLAMPKPSAFTRARQPASASVMLQLYPGRSMERDQVAAIVHLVASSIPDLATERVTVIDQAGRLLTNNDPNDPNVVAAVQFEQRRRFEENLVARIQALLEPLAGPGRVSAQVSVDMDFSVIEEARESYQPDPAKLRSEQVAESTSTAPNQNEGIPGATANTPPGAAANAEAGTAQTASRSATRNFEMDRTLTHSRSDTGRVQRITAAVLIDHVLSVPAAVDPAAAANPAADPAADSAAAPATAAAATLPAVQPLSAEQLAQVEALVKQAIGFSEARGDAVSVMNAPFLRETPEPIDMTVPLWEQPIVRDIARNVLGAGLVLLLIFAVVRPALRSLVGPSPRSSATATAHVSEDDLPLLTGETENGSGMPILPGTVSNTREQREAMVASARTLDEKLELARSTVAQDPKIVAQVVKNWVAADG